MLESIQCFRDDDTKRYENLAHYWRGLMGVACFLG